jgi:Ca-activated chloride channel homolog
MTIAQRKRRGVRRVTKRPFPATLNFRTLQKTATLCAAAACAFAAVPWRAMSARNLAPAQEFAQADGQWHPFGQKSGSQPLPGSSSGAGPTYTPVNPSTPVQSSNQSPNQGPTIKSQTNLVSILASVSDENGKPVVDLPQSAFSLKEEGVPQKIERFEAQTNRPVDLALMIDASASTFKDEKFELDASARFVKQVVRPGDALSVFEIAERVTEIGDFSDNVSRLENDVRKIQPGSGTSIYDAVVLGSDSLKHRPEGRRRAIVMVTDAGETTSGASFEEARRAAIASEELIYTVVIRPVKNENGRNTAGEHALITITDSTGGNFFTLDDLGQIGAMFDEINRELRTQYLLGYYPQPTPPAGSDRHVELAVAGNYKVSYRKEYFTAR